MSTAQSARRVRVAHLIPTDGLGGVETAARSMAVRTDLPIDFQVVCLSPRRQTSRSILLNPLTHISAWLRLVRSDPDVLIVSLWPTVIVAALFLLVRPRVKLVAFLHAERATGLADKLAYAWFTRRAQEIWADSEATLSARVALEKRHRTRVISFVVDRLAPDPRRSSTPAPNLVTWGRIAHQKGIDRSIRLVRLLADRGLTPRLDIYGPDDGEQEKLEALAAEFGVQQMISFRGPISRERLASIAAEASFFLLPSRFEGMAMAAVEAMQLGLAPVVTPVGQIGSYCLDGVNAVVVDPDALEAAADGIAALIDAPQRYRTLTDAALSTWSEAKLYADDVSDAAIELSRRR